MAHIGMYNQIMRQGGANIYGQTLAALNECGLSDATVYDIARRSQDTAIYLCGSPDGLPPAALAHVVSLYNIDPAVPLAIGQYLKLFDEPGAKEFLKTYAVLHLLRQAQTATLAAAQTSEELANHAATYDLLLVIQQLQMLVIRSTAGNGSAATHAHKLKSIVRQLNYITNLVEEKS
jgi:hypothetical protein